MYMLYRSRVILHNQLLEVVISPFFNTSQTLSILTNFTNFQKQTKIIDKTFKKL